MSRAFVKENDLEHAGTDLPERPQSEHPNYVTLTGLAQLQQQLAALEQERLQWSPLKEDPVARQKMAVIDRDLRYLQGRLERAIPVNPAEQAQDIALFGAIVEVEDEEGVTHAFEIVGEDEADIQQNKVSWVSPLAKALIGHKVGESVVWRRPAGDLALDIINIRYPQ
jgi:transcription elongation factor GreB